MVQNMKYIDSTVDHVTNASCNKYIMGVRMLNALHLEQSMLQIQVILQSWIISSYTGTCLPLTALIKAVLRDVRQQIRLYSKGALLH